MVSDLVTRSQIKAALGTKFTYLYSNEYNVEEAFNLIIIDLANNKIELAKVLSSIKESGKIEHVHAFYPHVSSDLADLARSYGVKFVYPRSKFFSSYLATL